MNTTQFKRICLEIVVGIIISVILSAILISLGYYKVNSNDLDKYSVNFIGVTIYNITKINGDFVGEAINQNMSMIGIICSVILIIVNETRIFIKNKK